MLGMPRGGVLSALVITWGFGPGIGDKRRVSQSSGEPGNLKTKTATKVCADRTHFEKRSFKFVPRLFSTSTHGV